MFRVEAFATGIKLESNDQSPFWGPIKRWWPPNCSNQRIKNTWLQFDFWHLKIKWSRAELSAGGTDQVIKHFNRWHISDYPLLSLVPRLSPLHYEKRKLLLFFVWTRGEPGNEATQTSSKKKIKIFFKKSTTSGQHLSSSGVTYNAHAIAKN